MFSEPHITTVLLLVVLATALSAAVQQKPDFSGEWVLNRQASTLSRGADAMQSGVVHIDHKEPVFRYKATFVGDGKPIEYAYELVSDGREVSGTQQGRTSVSSLRWDHDALVFTGRIQSADAELTLSFRYELLDSGHRLRAVEELRGGGRSQDNVWIFDRR